MTIRHHRELTGLRRAGRAVKAAMDAMTEAAAAGVSTQKLDDVGARVLEHLGARSAPQLFAGFPGTTCISINDEAVHGIPGPRRLRRGDVVKIDVAVELDGYIADACTTVCVPPASPAATRLVRAARLALDAGARRAVAGAPINGIGRAVETEVVRNGAVVIRALSGHGVGRRLHEEPTVRSYFSADDNAPMADGLVITIEPIVAEASGQVLTGPDGWTISTVDGGLSAQFEHTIVVTRAGPLLLTA